MNKDQGKKKKKKKLLCSDMILVVRVQARGKLVFYSNDTHVYRKHVLCLGIY